MNTIRLVPRPIDVPDEPGVWSLRHDQDGVYVVAIATKSLARDIRRLNGSLGLDHPPVRGFARAWFARQNGAFGCAPTDIIPPVIQHSLSIEYTVAPGGPPAVQTAWLDTEWAARRAEVVRRTGKLPVWDIPKARPATPAEAAATLDAQWIVGLQRGNLEAAAQILDHIATRGFGQAPRVAEPDGLPDGAEARFVSRFLVDNQRLYVGWTLDRRAFVSVWAGADCIFGENDGCINSDGGKAHAGVHGVAAFRTLVERLLTHI